MRYTSGPAGEMPRTSRSGQNSSLSTNGGVWLLSVGETKRKKNVVMKTKHHRLKCKNQADSAGSTHLQHLSSNTEVLEHNYYPGWSFSPEEVQLIRPHSCVVKIKHLPRFLWVGGKQPYFQKIIFSAAVANCLPYHSMFQLSFKFQEKSINHFSNIVQAEPPPIATTPNKNKTERKKNAPIPHEK